MMNISVCLSVTRIAQKPHGQTLPMFVRFLARFFSDGFAIRYILPVLSVTSYCQIMCSMVRQQRNSRNWYIDSNHILLSNKDHQIYIVSLTPGAKFAIYECVFCLLSVGRDNYLIVLTVSKTTAVITASISSTPLLQFL